MDKQCVVLMAKTAERQLPKHIAEAARVWAEAVEEDGLRATRKLFGYHASPFRDRGWGSAPSASIVPTASFMKNLRAAP